MLEKYFSTMQVCVYCLCRLRADAMQYLLSDIADEILAWMEVQQKIELEVDENSCLCEKCFTFVTNSWAAVQEPEVVEHKEPVVPVDPLSGSGSLVDVCDLVEVKSESHENSEEKLKVTTDFVHGKCVGSTDLLEVLDTKTADKDDLDFVQVLDIKEPDKNDPDYIPNLESDSDSSADSDMNMEVRAKTPPVLDGSALNCFVKCDWCKTQLSKTCYRILPDGLEKEYIVNHVFDSDIDPQRVCNACWNKARTYVTREENADSIAIPGYHRLLKTCVRCLVPKCKSKGRNVVPPYLRRHLLHSFNLFASINSRICPEHSKEYCIDWSFLKNEQVVNEFSTKDVTEMLDCLREDALKHP